MNRKSPSYFSCNRSKASTSARPEVVLLPSDTIAHPNSSRFVLYPYESLLAEAAAGRRTEARNASATRTTWFRDMGSPEFALRWSGGTLHQTLQGDRDKHPVGWSTAAPG